MRRSSTWSTSASLRGRFPLLFGLSVIGFMSMNLFSMRSLNSDNAAAFFRRGLAVQIVAVTALLAIVIVGATSIVDRRAAHRPDGVDARRSRARGLCPVHGLLPAARRQRVLGLHDDDVLVGRSARRSYGRAVRRHVAADRRSHGISSLLANAIGLRLPYRRRPN